MQPPDKDPRPTEGQPPPAQGGDSNPLPTAAGGAQAHPASENEGSGAGFDSGRIDSAASGGGSSRSRNHPIHYEDSGDSFLGDGIGGFGNDGEGNRDSGSDGDPGADADRASAAAADDGLTPGTSDADAVAYDNGVYDDAAYDDEDFVYDDSLDEPPAGPGSGFDRDAAAALAAPAGGVSSDAASASVSPVVGTSASVAVVQPGAQSGVQANAWNPQQHKTVYIEDIEGGQAGGAGGGGRRGADEDDDSDGDDDEEKSSGGSGMNFWHHVEDLRWVIVKSVGTFVAAMLIMMFFSVYAQKLLTWPLTQGMSLIGRGGEAIDLRTDGPFSVFTFLLQLWVFGGLILSMPFILYFCAGFIAPGLTEREKRLLRPVVFGALGLFLVGALFAFGLLLPTYIGVSLQLEKVFGFASLWTPSNYYGAVVWTTLGLGLVFQFPLVLIILQYMGLVKTQTLRQFRRHAFVVILVIAAALTPGGDPITLTITTAPLYLLFEAALMIGERLSRKIAAASGDADAAAAEDDDDS